MIISILAGIFTALGCLMILILFVRIQAVNNEITLKKHRSKAAGFADLLNFAAVVEDGIVVGKNGSFMAAWLYEGDDNGSSTNAQREAISMRINQALAGLGNGWMVHVDAVRRPAPAYSESGRSHFSDPVSKAIDEERRRQFEGLGQMYEGYFVFCVTYFPPLLAQRKFIEMMFEDDAAKPTQKSHTADILTYFRREVLNIESRLSSAIRLTRLCGHKVNSEEGREVIHDDLLRWIQFCATGLNHPVVLPETPIYLDALIGGQEMYSGVVPKIGRNFIQFVAIEGFPLESTPGILSALAEQPCEYRWSSRFIFMDTHEAVNHLDKYRKKWKQKVRGFFDQVFNTNSGSIDQDAVSMVQDAEAAMSEVNSGLVAQGYYTSGVILMGENRVTLEAAARFIEKTINRLGFSARVETVNTLDAFLGSLPSHGVENVRRPLLNTLNLADLLPTSSIWTGLNFAPCPMYPSESPPLMHCITNGSTPFRLNLHVSDVGHTFLFGPTGAGKSTHLAILAAQFKRYEGISVYCFDKGMSMYPLAKAVGGQHYNIGGDGEKLAFCPLQFLESRSGRAWAMEWIDLLLALNKVDTTPVQRNDIGHAIMSMHESGAKTLSEFVLTVQDNSIREALKQYTIDGAMGHLLDAESDGLNLSDFTVFEISDLMDMGDKFALPVLLYLFHRIESKLNGQPAVIILDEAWQLLGHAVFREKIKQWLKTLRKANCIVVMATQSITDASNSGIFDVIVESTATKIFLPNVYARDEHTAALYRRMGMNSRQIEILATSIPKRQYYFMSSNGRRLYDLALGPLALAFVGSSDKESIEKIQALVKEDESSWVKKWLSIKNLNLHDYE